MKKFYSMLLLALALVAQLSCSSSNSLGAVVDPAFSDKIKNVGGELIVTGRLMSQKTGGEDLSAEAMGELKEGKYHFTVDPTKDLPESPFFALNVYYRAQIAQAQIAKESGQAVGADDLLIAQGSVPYSRDQEMKVDDYDYSADADSDFLANIAELEAGSNPKKEDTDGDGVMDGLDFFPTVVAEWADLDGDGIGDNQDDDVDGDGIKNDDEKLIGTNPRSADSDSDGINDKTDNCSLASNADQADANSDGRGDACSDDADGDGLKNTEEAGIGTSATKADTDGDGLGDGYEFTHGSNPLSPDSDGDGKGDNSDNCPIQSNSDQGDIDGDKIGDVCDPDKDNDGVVNVEDVCPSVADEQGDIDGDAKSATNGAGGDLCDDDIDGDGIANDKDNCPYTSNPVQQKIDDDADGAALECDLDDRDPLIGSAQWDKEKYAIFVDPSAQKKDARGTKLDPLNSLSDGITKAKAKGVPLVVAAGEYDIKGIAWQANLSVFGGFYENFTKRDYRSVQNQHRTLFARSDADHTLLIGALDSVTFDGIHFGNKAPSTIARGVEGGRTVLLQGSGSKAFRNCTIAGNPSMDLVTAFWADGVTSLTLEANKIDGGGLSESISNALYVANSSTARIVNNIIDAGKGSSLRALEIKKTSAIVANNTVVASAGSTGRSVEGIVVRLSSPILVNNAILTSNNGDHRPFSLECSQGLPSNSTAVKNNYILESPAPSFGTTFVNCSGTSFDLSSVTTFQFGPVTAVDHMYTSAQKQDDLINADYTAKHGVGKGFQASTPEEGKVERDYNFNLRPASGIDVGAFQK